MPNLLTLLTLLVCSYHHLWSAEKQSPTVSPCNAFHSTGGGGAISVFQRWGKKSNLSCFVMPRSQEHSGDAEERGLTTAEEGVAPGSFPASQSPPIWGKRGYIIFPAPALSSRQDRALPWGQHQTLAPLLYIELSPFLLPPVGSLRAGTVFVGALTWCPAEGWLGMNGADSMC